MTWLAIDPNIPSRRDDGAVPVLIEEIPEDTQIGDTLIAVQAAEPDHDEPDFVSTAVLVGYDERSTLAYVIVDWAGFHDESFEEWAYRVASSNDDQILTLLHETDSDAKIDAEPPRWLQRVRRNR